MKNIKTFLLLLSASIFLGAIPVRKTTIFTIGDSTMANKDTALNNPETGWGQVFATFFNPMKVEIENHAADGRSTRSFIDEGKWQVVVNKMKAGDYVIIQFGHNDEKAENPKLYTDPSSSYQRNLVRFVEETRAKGAHPILLTSIVRRRFGPDGKLVDTHGDYPEAVRKVAAKHKVPMLDLERKTRQLLVEQGADESKKIYLHLQKGASMRYPEGRRDDTHLSKYGAFAVSKLVVEEISALGLPLKSYLCESNNEILFSRDQPVYVHFEKKEEAVGHTALAILKQDLKAVFNADLETIGTSAKAKIIAGTLGKSSEIDRLVMGNGIDVSSLKGKWEAFVISALEVKGKKKLIVIGSDSRGTAYGLLEISRLMGVSPWEWWADVKPGPKDFLLMPELVIEQSPSVQYRGIFLNDEDWGLTPWSTHTFEPDAKTLYPVKKQFKGTIGPKTYGRIFELLLRLRANSIWPAMHEVTMPFYFVKGNREMAEKYGIFVGSSHCEPLSRNSATEWDLAGKGEYNYLTNKESIISYWSDRLKELKGSNNIFTVGMRGKHDGPMQGVKTTEEYRDALQKVFSDQAGLLEKYINPNIGKVPQMLIPYKEVLDVYHAGLSVPDHVTLMWCDDNYGYLTHFPDEREQQRTGGNGVYYHLSYWGRPHDYLWLGTANPALLHHQLKLAYEKMARKIWIVNVGDIKAIEYQTELFLDMAWNMQVAKDDDFSERHLDKWLDGIFGSELAEQLVPVMQEHYRLAYIRKPEFMGNTREEESAPGYRIVKDLPWSEKKITDRLSSYQKLSSQVEKLASSIPANRKSAYFELIKYPVQAADQMNRKLLYGQLARHGKTGWEKSHLALDSITSLTNQYNSLENAKWNRMMDHQPRNLPVFQKLKEQTVSTTPLPTDKTPLYELSGSDFRTGEADVRIIKGLGYQGNAIMLGKGSVVGHNLENLAGDSVVVDLRLLPSHPISGKTLKLRVELGGKSVELDYATKGRNEEWKENVLRNQAIRRATFPVAGKKPFRLTITALDEGVVLDQLFVYENK